MCNHVQCLVIHEIRDCTGLMSLQCLEVITEILRQILRGRSWALDEVTLAAQGRREPPQYVLDWSAS